MQVHTFETIDVRSLIRASFLFKVKGILFSLLFYSVCVLKKTEREKKKRMGLTSIYGNWARLPKNQLQGVS